MRWADLESDAPRLAERARERLVDPGVVLVATIRRDGTPRLSPVEPLVLDGDLWLSMMWQSRKTADLLVDDRILVHSIVTGPDGDEGEIKIRGQAVPIDDPELRLHYCDAVQSLGWRPVEPYFHLFVVDMADVTSIRYAKVATSTSLDGQHASSSCAVRPHLRVSANQNPSPICSGRSSHCPIPPGA